MRVSRKDEDVEGGHCLPAAPRQAQLMWGDSECSHLPWLHSNSRGSSGAAGSAARPSSLGRPPRPAARPARSWVSKQDGLVFGTERTSRAWRWQGLEAAVPHTAASAPSLPQGDPDWLRVSWTASAAVSLWGTLTLVPQLFSVPQRQCQPRFCLSVCSGYRAVSQPAGRWLLQVLELLCTFHVRGHPSHHWHPRIPLRDLIPSAPRPVAVGQGQQRAWSRRLSCSRPGSGEGAGEAQLPTPNSQPWAAPRSAAIAV